MVYKLNERTKITEPTPPFECFGTSLKIVRILKHGHLDCCHPASAENILTFNWIYLKGSDGTNSFNGICKIYLRPNFYQPCWNFIKSVKNDPTIF